MIGSNRRLVTTRRRVAGGVLVVLACLLVLGAGAHAQEAEVLVERLNVRAGPGKAYPVVEVVTRGEKLPVEGIEGRWVKLKWPTEAWVYEKYVKLPKDFAVPAFSDAENAFLEWAGATGDIEELSIEDKGVIWVILKEGRYATKQNMVEIAERLACGYRKETGYPGKAVVTVYPPSGPDSSALARASCE